MALNDHRRSSPVLRSVSIYLTVLGFVLLIVAGASVIWMSTDNSGTNFLASDPESTSPQSESAAP
jgi:hypothetical protein